MLFFANAQVNIAVSFERGTTLWFFIALSISNRKLSLT